MTGNVILELRNKSGQSIQIIVEDLAYKTPTKTLNLAPNSSQKLRLDLQKSHHWYDFVVKIVGGINFERHYAGHVETGKESFTDPAMGEVM